MGGIDRRKAVHCEGLARKIQATVRAARIAVAALCISFATTSSSQAQECERLADGRAIIVVKGTNVALPSQASELHGIKFDLSNSKDLKWAIGSSIEARQFFGIRIFGVCRVPVTAWYQVRSSNSDKFFRSHLVLDERGSVLGQTEFLKRMDLTG